MKMCISAASSSIMALGALSLAHVIIAVIGGARLSMALIGARRHRRISASSAASSSAGVGGGVIGIGVGAALGACRRGGGNVARRRKWRRRSA